MKAYDFIDAAISGEHPWLLDRLKPEEGRFTPMFNEDQLKSKHTNRVIATIQWQEEIEETERYWLIQAFREALDEWEAP